MYLARDIQTSTTKHGPLIAHTLLNIPTTTATPAARRSLGLERPNPLTFTWRNGSVSAREVAA